MRCLNSVRQKMTPKERNLELSSRNGPRSRRVEKRSKRQHRPWEDLELRKREEVVCVQRVSRRVVSEPPRVSEWVVFMWDFSTSVAAEFAFF